MENSLAVSVYHGRQMPGSNAAVLQSDENVLLIDTQFQKTDARELLRKINAIERPLKSILLTHSHPDHVWGAAELLEACPDVTVYAREPIAMEIDLEFRARQLRWTEMFTDEIPSRLFDIEPLTGDVFDFDGHSIEIIDLKPAETIHATAFYLPDSKTYISGDQLYNRCHFYVGGGLNRPELWIESINDIVANYDMERVIPGHGAVGGTEIFDRAIEYLEYYADVARPLTPQPTIIEAMLKRFPDYKMEGVLYMTRGPAMTSPTLLKQTGGKLSFGHGQVVD